MSSSTFTTCWQDFTLYGSLRRNGRILALNPRVLLSSEEDTSLYPYKPLLQQFRWTMFTSSKYWHTHEKLNIRMENQEDASSPIFMA